MTIGLPEPPKASSSWLELGERVLMKGMLPLAFLALVLWFTVQVLRYHVAQTEIWRKELVTAEERTRTELKWCIGEIGTVKKEVRTSAAEVKAEVKAAAPPAQPAPTP